MALPSDNVLLGCSGTVDGTTADTGPDNPGAEQSQQSSSLDILMFVSLLIMTVLTIWLFKHIRARFVHETGLAVIYGLIVGAIIKYTSFGRNAFIDLKCYGNNNLSNLSSFEPPDRLRLEIFKDGTNSSPSSSYQYMFVTGGQSKQPDLVEKATFNPELFFNVLLPPIIFCAGYSMKRKHFFKNFGAISAFAFLGTLISSFAVGSLMYGFLRMLSDKWEFKYCMLFGAIISATDPVTILAIFNDLNVDVDLYALVFGESVLNDAVAIVLVSTIETYSTDQEGFDGSAILKSLGSFVVVFVGSFLLGSGMGCITALMTKYTHIRDYPLLETSLFFMMSYCTFLAAEAAKMTGIVAVLFCGICQAHYTYNNLSTESKARTKQLFELLNFLMENFVFAYIGVSTFTHSQHSWDIAFIGFAFISIIIGRALNIYPLSAMLNLGRSNKIRYNFQHLMMFSGLRGAMAFALAIRKTDDTFHKTIFSTTLLIVIATVILCGGLTTQMLQWLSIRVGVAEDRELQSFESLGTSPSEPRVAHMELSPGRLAEKAYFVRLWYNFDANFVKPLLTHARPPLTDSCSRCCLPLARLLTTDQQQQQATLVGSEQIDDSDADLVADDHELNYGERSDHRNHSIVNSVYNDNHTVNSSGAPAQELLIVETHSVPASLQQQQSSSPPASVSPARTLSDDQLLLDSGEDDQWNFDRSTNSTLLIEDDFDEDDVADDAKLLQA